MRQIVTMVNLKIFLKAFFEMLIDLSARFLLPMLIWCGAVISLANSGNGFLALILVFSGIAWTYREFRFSKRGNRKQ